MCEFSDIPAKTVPILYFYIFQCFRGSLEAMRQDIDGLFRGPKDLLGALQPLLTHFFDQRGALQAEQLSRLRDYTARQV